MNELEIPNNMNEYNSDGNLHGSQIETCLQSTPATFLEIAGISHDENSWSDIYAYFFDSNNPHKLGLTFFDCLINHIRKKMSPDGKLDIPALISNVNVYREVPTKSKRGQTSPGRIDLLLFADDIVVIIENKVFHNLTGNDLDDYMDLVGAYNHKRLGVILSLKPIYVSNDKYINITHLELLESVYKTIADKPCDGFCRIIINQFYNNVKNMSGVSLDNQNQFLTERTEILKHARLLDEVKEWYYNVFNDREFINAIKNKTSLKFDITDRPTKKYRYLQLKINNAISLDILFEPLWNLEYDIHYFPSKCQSLFVTLEIGNFNNLRIKDSNIVDKIKELVPSELYLEPRSLNWWHFACVEIPISDSELFDNQLLANKLLDDNSKTTCIFDILKNKKLFKIGTDDAN